VYSHDVYSRKRFTASGGDLAVDRGCRDALRKRRARCKQQAREHRKTPNGTDWLHETSENDVMKVVVKVSVDIRNRLGKNNEE
jgi:hypothetical protein